MSEKALSELVKNCGTCAYWRRTSRYLPRFPKAMAVGRCLWRVPGDTPIWLTESGANEVSASAGVHCPVHREKVEGEEIPDPRKGLYQCLGCGSWDIRESASIMHRYCWCAGCGKDAANAPTRELARAAWNDLNRRSPRMPPLLRGMPSPHGVRDNER